MTELLNNTGKYNVQNFAEGGKNTTEVLAEQIPRVSDKCIIICGTNDTRIDAKHVDVGVSINNVSNMINSLQSRGITPYICTVTPILNSVPSQLPALYSVNSIQQVNEFNSRLITLCNDKGVAIIDNNKAISDVDNYSTLYSDDGVHLNDGGYSILVENICRNL